MHTETPPTWIDTEAELERWTARIAGVPWLGIDTESDSFHRYREKVCLIQMTALGEDVIIDPLAIASLQSLSPILRDPKTTKIFHDAGYDLICLHRDFGFEVRGLFDTMLASRLLGERHFGLAAILQARFAFTADKRHQRSDWAQRPLSAAQLHYARSDTHYLPQLALDLSAELQAAGRLAWAEEEFARLPESALRASGRTPVRDAQSFWRVQGAKVLDPASLGRLQQLYMARERIAERLDRPAFKVFADDVLLQLARTPPHSADDLRPRPGFRRQGIHRFGPELLAALAQAQPITGPAPKGSGRRRRTGRMLDPDAKARFEALRTQRRESAETLGLEPEVVLSNAILEDLAQNPPQNAEGVLLRPEFAGWRREHLVRPILTCLSAAAAAIAADAAVAAAAAAAAAEASPPPPTQAAQVDP